MISVLIPTMGRPARLRDCVNSVFATAACPARVEVLVRVDREDPECRGYELVQQDIVGACRFFYPLACSTYGWGIEYLRQHAKGSILFAGGDDTLFRTPGWDETVEAAFAARPDGLLVAYANNGRDREKCEHFFTTKRWCEVLGYMCRTEFRHFCVDLWVEDLAKAIGRLVFLREVVVEHVHKKYGKAPDDPVYRLVRGNTRTSERDNLLYRALAGERAEGLARLRQALVRERCQREGVDT